MKNDLISVIIPMYKMEKFIAKCLDSVIAQSYRNLEIICVDDGSPDKSAEIVLEYAKKDRRIILVKNPQNMGLFRARVEGMKVAKGQFIAHVDADDFISVDWLRLLHKKAVEENADMTLGNTVNVNEELRYDYYNNYRSLTSSHKTIEGDDLLKTFFKQEGSCFIWHTIWNKLYTKRLIDECMPYFKRIKHRLIMGEDIAFSSVLWSHANKLAFANVDAYFYYRHSEASTSISLPLQKIISNIKDLKLVFDYLENSLKDYDSRKYKRHYKSIVSFKNRYHRIWSGNVYAKGAQNDTETRLALKNTFGKDEIILPTTHEFYFYELTTPWSKRLEDLKKAIIYNKFKVISFDIFDTLIKRPFYKPEDVWLFVGKFAEKLLLNVTDKSFVEMRKMADSLARGRLKIEKPQFEDVTLSEIYNEMAEYFKIDKTIAEQIKEEENRLEKTFCTSRNTGKELFELALAAGKKVVLTSDMYLEKPVVEEILNKNGYSGYTKLYLSSEQRSLKTTGKLFAYMIDDIKEDPSSIMHIGDSWNIDIVKAQEKGIVAMFIPKAVETFENKISDIYAGNSFKPFLTKSANCEDATAAMSQLPVRCMLGVVANELFDNPFNIYQANSDYNGDAYRAGYYTLGMHLMGVAKWILDGAIKNGYKKIVFLARDGKVLKQIFDHLCEKVGANIETDYFYATRRALMPYSIKTANDLYKLCDFMDLVQHTPQEVLDFCKVVLKPLTDELKDEYFENGIMLNDKFKNKFEFYKFIEAVKKLSFDEELLKQKRAEAEVAFGKVFTENSATFDIGYSGRLQSIICELANKKVDTFFIHSNGDNTRKDTKYKFNIHSFYDFTPTMTGIVREFLISEPAASCVEYKIENDVITPVLEEKEFAYENIYAVLEFQKGAWHFSKKFIDTFAEYIMDFKFRSGDTSIAFENYMLNAQEFDRYTFVASLAEDTVYSGYEAKNIFDIWTWHQNQLERPIKTVYQSVSPTEDMFYAHIAKWSKFKRALYYLLFDRKKFKEKLKKNMKKKK